jgi:protein gp37
MGEGAVSDNSSIEWTDATWSPATGCDRISPGCDNCYALTLAKRLKAMGSAKYQNDGNPRTSGPGFGLTVHPATLDLPWKWRKPKRIFVNPMSDLWHARVPAPFVGGVWNTMALTPWHTYQILTKRPERMRRMLAKWADAGWYWRKEDLIWCGPLNGPLPNVHLGTSIELDEYAHRADHLRETPATIRFLSLEPLLGALPSLNLDGIHWCIIGGESGPGSRPLDLGWVRELIVQCQEAGTAIFVKQLGSCWAAANGGHGKGGDWDLWPEDLRIREFPVVAAPAGAK